MTSRVGPENSRLNPRSMVTLATIATITAGNTAMTENRLTIWMCNLAAARPRRRAWTTSQTSRTMMPTSSRMIAALIRRKETTTTRVGSIRVRPVSTTKVRNVDSRARPTANGASHLHRDHPLDSANDGSNDAAEVSALVIPAKGELKASASPGQWRRRTDAFISQCCQNETNLWDQCFNKRLYTISELVFFGPLKRRR